MRKVRKIILALAFAVSIILNIYLLRSNIHNYFAAISENGKINQKSTDTGHKKNETENGGQNAENKALGASRQVLGKNATKLNYAALDSVSNEKKSWGLPGNHDHKAPEISAATGELLGKYGGIYIGDTASNKVYLTFDEGYENGYTPAILDTLKLNKVKTIFFVTKPYVQKNSGLVKRMLDEGHKVGSHTVSHPSLPEIGKESLEKELAGFDGYFYSEFNAHFKYLRPPSGEYSERVLEAARELGYKSVFWSFAYLDYDVNNQKGTEYAYNKVMDNLHNGAVILLHAVSKDNTEALDRIIKGIRKQGYALSSFDL
jgi:peptidoglycan-N-acetylmuramic acid deacetylase